MRILILVIAFVFLASASYSADIEYEYRSGIRNADTHNTEEAINNFKRVIDWTEKDVAGFFKSKGRLALMEGTTFNDSALHYNVNSHEFLGRLYIRQSNNGKDKKLFSKGVAETDIACERGSSRACSFKENLSYSKNAQYFNLMKKRMREQTTGQE